MRVCVEVAHRLQMQVIKGPCCGATHRGLPACLPALPVNTPYKSGGKRGCHLTPPLQVFIGGKYIGGNSGESKQVLQALAEGGIVVT